LAFPAPETRQGARAAWSEVLLDAELAELYGVTTTRLNQQVRRNGKRFPADFLFELTAQEFANLKLHFATSSWGGRRDKMLDSALDQTSR
jgi:hypothetical protein